MKSGTTLGNTSNEEQRLLFGNPCPRYDRFYQMKFAQLNEPGEVKSETYVFHCGRSDAT